jgi:hypothetical protein
LDMFKRVFSSYRSDEWWSSEVLDWCGSPLPAIDLKSPASINSPREFIGLILLLLSSLVFSLGFSCATPLAAFGAIAAVAFSRRDALILCGAVWFLNQVVGYSVLRYPWRVNSV